MADVPGGPVAGQVFRYAFLWERQHEAGETEGRKTRPACLAVTTATSQCETLPSVLPITTQPPTEGRLAAEVPPIEVRRAGLGTDTPCWVMLDEIDTDVLERSWVLEDRRPLGRFGPAFADRLRRALIAAAKAGRAGIVDRQG